MQAIRQMDDAETHSNDIPPGRHPMAGLEISVTRRSTGGRRAAVGVGRQSGGKRRRLLRVEVKGDRRGE